MTDHSRDGGQTPTDDSEPYRSTRRHVLQGATTAATLTGTSGVALGSIQQVATQQDGDGATGDGEPLDPAETIILGGVVEGWMGRDPQRISGTTNPTLNLVPGETYDLTWINVDGLPHNIAFLDAEGNVLRRTGIIDETGARQSVSFKATEEMATYLCQVHPTSMRASITLRGVDQGPTQPAAEALVPQGPTVGLRKIAGEPLTQPLSMSTTTVGGSEERFIVDQTGEVYHLAREGLAEFLDISPRIVMQDDGFDERGLLGLAFHPNYPENRRFYVRYSGRPRQTELPEGYDHVFVLSEFRASDGDLLQADPESERKLLTIPEPQFNHNAGDITFGPDGNLFVTVGDGGGADDTGLGHVNDWYERNGGGNGQDVTTNLLGSILRIDVDSREGDRAYGIPDDNPFVGTEGLDEIYAYGFRNPWRFSFHDGDLIVADVGQNLWEEIDVVQRGGNYGWNVREGFHCFSTESPNDPTAITECPTGEPDAAPYDGSPFLEPVLEYPHRIGNRTIGLSVTGGYVYQGDRLGSLSGRYVFGDWSAGFQQPNGRLWVADLPAQGEAEGFSVPASEDAQFPMQELQVAGSPDGNLGRTVLAFGRDQAGELYVLASQTTTVDGTGEVFKLVPPGEGDEL